MKKTLRVLFACDSPLAGGICALFLSQTLLTMTPLMVPLPLLLTIPTMTPGSQNGLWPLAIAIAIAWLSLFLYAIALWGVFFTAVLKHAFPEQPPQLWYFWGWGVMLAAFPLNCLLILLPAAMKRQSVVAIILAVTGTSFGIAVFYFLFLQNGWLQGIYLATTFLYLAAMISALPNDRPRWYCGILAGLFLFTVFGIYLSEKRTENEVEATRVKLEQHFGIELTPKAFWERDAKLLPQTEPPWSILLENSNALYDLQSDLQYIPEAFEDDWARFAQFWQEYPEVIDAANQLTDIPSTSIQHDYEKFLFHILLPELRLIRPLARIYALQMRYAAKIGDRDAWHDASRRLENLRSSQDQPSILISGLIGIAAEEIYLQSCAESLSSPVLTDADLLALRDRIQQSGQKCSQALLFSVSGEVVSTLDIMNSPEAAAQTLLELYSNKKALPISDRITPLFRYWLHKEKLYALQYFLSIPELDHSQSVTALLEAPQPHFALCSLLLVERSLIYRRSAEILDQATALELTIAVERYRRKNGVLPESLDSLVPEFLPQLPIDRLNHLPYQYEFGQLETEQDIKASQRNGYRIKYSGMKTNYRISDSFTVPLP